ncbi:hypothetical protein TSMEX_009500 [Taenia solium]|eukprot:TsM_000117600 transcript=TsM_000117600 gene=TsM_000117600
MVRARRAAMAGCLADFKRRRISRPTNLQHIHLVRLDRAFHCQQCGAMQLPGRRKKT